MSVGGKLRRAEVAGYSVDVGAESMLARRPEATGLVADLGLGGRLTHPEPVPAAVWSRGRRWPLPRGTVMGVPTDPAAAAGVLTPEEVVRASAEQVGPPVVEDVAVGTFVADRVGPAVVDRLVEPLLAGVYAGHARSLSLQATVPALWAAATDGAAIVGRSATDATRRAGLRGVPRRARSARLRPRRRRRGSRRADPDPQHGPRAGPPPGRLAADRRTDHRQRSPRCRRRRARAAGDPGRPTAAPLLIECRRAARRDRLRVRGHRDLGAPAVRGGPAGRLGLPRPAGRAAGHQGRDLQLDEVGLAGRGRPTTSSFCAPRSAGPARSPCCNETTTTSCAPWSRT